MPIIDNKFFGVNGEFVTGKVPNRIINCTPQFEIDSEQFSRVSHVYSLFRDTVRTSVVGVHVAHSTFPDMSVRMESFNGVDRVFVWVGGGKQERILDALYVDTGDLQVEYPFPLSPTRLDASKLKFMDISPAVTTRWLGEVYVTVLSYPLEDVLSLASRSDIDLISCTIENDVPLLGTQTCEQRSKRPMVENMDSFAIGYKVTAPPEDLQKEKDRYGSVVVSKKMVMADYPASIWTGKMRFFMQAQYGMPLWMTHWHFGEELVGLSYVLKYTYSDKFGDHEWTPGVTSASSPILYSGDDGLFWILDINATDGDTEYTVYSYPLEPQGNSATELASAYKRYKAGEFVPEFYESGVTSYALLSDAEIDGIETYIFAYSKIELGKKKTVGKYTLPSPGGGAPIAYGWKGNKKGDKASIVLQKPSGTNGDYHIKSCTVHLSFGYEAANGDPNQQRFSVTGSTTFNADWIDGWGRYNIFVPDAVSGGPLVCWSPKMDWWPSGVIRNPLNFSSAVVYGYYKDDIWKEVTVSRNSTSYAEGNRPWTSNMTNLILHSSADAENDPAAWELGYSETGQPWSVEITYIHETDDWGIAFDGVSFQGTFTYKDVWSTENSYAGAYTNGVPGQFVFHQFGTGLAVEQVTASFSTYINTPCGTYTSCPDINGNYYNYTQSLDYTGIRTGVDTTTNKTDAHVWSFIVPNFDSESAYIVTANLTSYDTYSEQTTVSNPVFMMYQHVTGLNGAGGIDVTAYMSTVTWYPEEWIDSTSVSYDPPSSPWDIDTLAFNSEVSGVAADTPLNYQALFEVSKNYPYYDAGMYFVTSYNGRYWGSIGPKNPTSILDSPRFIGFA